MSTYQSLSKKMPIKIAVIDDDVDFSALMVHGLSLTGHEAISVDLNNKWQEQLQTFNPQIITIDLNLKQDMTGFDVIKTVSKSCPSAKLIVVTGYASISSTVECIKAGADNVFVKPITAKKLIEKLKETDKITLSTAPKTLTEAEFETIQETLIACKFNVSQAAKQLGLSRRTLQRKLKKRTYFF